MNLTDNSNIFGYETYFEAEQFTTKFVEFVKGYSRGLSIFFWLEGNNNIQRSYYSFCGGGYYLVAGKSYELMKIWACNDQFRVDCQNASY